MPVNALTNAAAHVESGLASRHGALFDAAPALRGHIAGQVVEWEGATRTTLWMEFPHTAHAENLRQWQQRWQASSDAAPQALQILDDYLAFCKAARQPSEEGFWRSRFAPPQQQATALAQKMAADPAISLRLLLQKWQERIDHVRAEWELREIAARRAALLARLDELLKLFQTLHERLNALGLDTGLLLDLSTGSLTTQDICQFERWARYLTQDEGIKRLCELLGRMRQIELSERIERVKTAALVHTALPDVHAREEIVGIRLGNDIEHALPSELALLADPETALLFDLKYVESALMCFDMQGMRDVCEEVEVEQEQSVAEADKQGPMVICIDTSGSMSGMPETVAKAVALFLAARARESRRPCYLINFSTTIDTLDLSGEVGMAALLRFLGMSFRGGTDVAPALEHALQVMEQDAYRNADLLVISDFIMAGLPEEFLARIEARRSEGNRFHSLVVGDAYMTQRLHTHFDNEWVYEPGRAAIHELIGFERKMLAPAQGAHCGALTIL